MEKTHSSFSLFFTIASFIARLASITISAPFQQSLKKRQVWIYLPYLRDAQIIYNYTLSMVCAIITQFWIVYFE